MNLNMTFAASWIRLRSDLWLIFMSRKPFPFNPLNKSGATDKNMEESGLHEKIWDCLYFRNWIEVLTLSLLL